MNGNKLVYMYIIADRKQKDALNEEITKAGAALIDFVYGRGYYESRNIFDFLGFNEEHGKIIISCILSNEKSAELIEILNEDYGFKKRGTGIAFTVPIEKVVY